MWSYYRRIILSALGSLLILGGLSVSYWWYFVMAPVRRSLDPEWINSHSPQDYWQEVQSGIRRGTWNHDDGFTVGYYGDESWARWIMARVKPGDNMGCAYSLHHSATAMRYITNHDAGEDADGWLGWWRVNQDKTQIDWIADGFRQRGLNVDGLPKPAEIEALLTLLGQPNTSGNKEDFLKYNAFRWLRDSGFEPVEYVLSGSELSDEVKSGLREYANLEGRFPHAGRLGNLAVAPGDSSSAEDFSPPAILTRRFQTTIGAMTWVPVVLGVVLMCLSLLGAARRKAPSPTS